MPHNNIHEKRFLDESVETKNYYPYKGMTKLQEESKINQSIYILKNIFSTYKHLLSSPQCYYDTNYKRIQEIRGHQLRRIMRLKYSKKQYF